MPRQQLQGEADVRRCPASVEVYLQCAVLAACEKGCA